MYYSINQLNNGGGEFPLIQYTRDFKDAIYGQFARIGKSLSSPDALRFWNCYLKDRKQLKC